MCNAKSGRYSNVFSFIIPQNLCLPAGFPRSRPARDLSTAQLLDPGRDIRPFGHQPLTAKKTAHQVFDALMMYLRTALLKVFNEICVFLVKYPSRRKRLKYMTFLASVNFHYLHQ